MRTVIGNAGAHLVKLRRLRRGGIILAMLEPSAALTCPGLFITATDTGVGKTVVACAIAHALRCQQPGLRLGVSKPFATGCRHDREGLVNPDAEALAHFADCRQLLDVINPIRYALPLAPAVAAEETSRPIDWPELRRALMWLDQHCDAMLIEGVGGLMVPLDDRRPRYTVLDFIRRIGYPVLVVTRSRLGTLNHTAMTVSLLKQAGCRVAGIAMNNFEPDAAANADDPSIASNRQWITRMTGVRVLAMIPHLKPGKIAADKGCIDPEILDAVAMTYWPDVLGPAQPR